MTVVGLFFAGGGAAIFDRLGQGFHEVAHQLRELGLQIVFLAGIALKIVKLNQGQVGIFLGVVWPGGAPATGAGAEREFPLAAPDGERAIDRVVDGERPRFGIRLAKQVR